MKRRNAPLALCALGGASALLLAETLAADTNRLPSVDIIGSNEDTFSLSGSAHVLSKRATACGPISVFAAPAPTAVTASP